MNKTLFKDTEVLIREVYNTVAEKKEPMFKQLSGEELKAYYSVIDFCEAIYEIETLGMTPDDD